MFERPQRGESAVLVHIDFPDQSDQEDLQEFQELVASAGALAMATITGSRQTPEAKYYIGKGKAETVAQRVKELGGELAIFNHDLSPSQERNLEKLLQCRVLDRSGLILDIFAQRARSFEGKLQVELAQLKHLSTRLVRGWSHLERQKGGIGLRGPGETQLESDRRLLAHRIKHINARLEKVRSQRDQGRRARLRADVPTLSVVGYTNAGKSTLFNCLCSANVHAADQLFATLDTTLRRFNLPGFGRVVLADTVGFIRKLPHELVTAVRSTLEETVQADLLLHVVDAHDPDRQIRIDQVNEVLRAIGAETVPQLMVLNKIDLTGEQASVLNSEQGEITKVWCSAKMAVGIELLEEAIGSHLFPDRILTWIPLPPTAARLRARLYALGEVLVDSPDAAGGWWLQVQISKFELERLLLSEGVSYPLFEDPPDLSVAAAAYGQ